MGEYSYCFIFVVIKKISSIMFTAFSICHALNACNVSYYLHVVWRVTLASGGTHKNNQGL